jgi:hypothetical protein
MRDMNRVAWFVVWLAVSGCVAADDRKWENPVFDTAEAAAAAARTAARDLDAASPASLRLFVDLASAPGEDGRRSSTTGMSRTIIGNLVVTHPRSFETNPVQRTTIERFRDAVPRQQSVLETRLRRFNYPPLDGMVYLRLVGSVDAFSGLSASMSDRMSQVGGVTYYCRYVLLPLSYVGEDAVRELRRSAARNPGLDVDRTIRGWQSESFANLVSTFRHELVHVHTNAAIGVPRYSNRTVIPTWFHEGAATYLANDPHAGLSERYQEYQELFFFLAQRHGIPRLQSFFASILEGGTVAAALVEVYAITDSDALFSRSARWHLLKERIKTGVWIIALVVVLLALRRTDRPYLGYLLVLAAVMLGLGVATGLAEHLYGLRGATMVTVGKLGFGLAALLIGGFGVKRIVRHSSLQRSG